MPGKIRLKCNLSPATATATTARHQQQQQHTQLMKATAATATSCRLSDELTGISVSHFSQLPNWPDLDFFLRRLKP